ncbi:hypothetical protein GIB67_034513 [Kingdonia uniflora]|uniref:Mot1 central domain-containing protein n=1 Tax=Kingdonia uniflora TaxID=39325 RepID=A0A7J7PB30_9MAGN|nr:hypothetical protein GIB67_034513 [Kingdonia uniflora]
MIPKTFGALTSKEKPEFDLNEALVVDGPGEGITYDENPSMLSTLAPRLWLFMRHNISSVRHSAIRTLERLLEAGCRRGSSECSDRSLWPSLILGDTLRIVFQNLLLEANEEIMQCSERVWRLLLQYGSTLDPTKMFWPIALPRKSHFRAAAKMRAANLEKDYNINFGIESEKETFPHEKNGVFVKIIVGANGEKSVTHTRVVTATALGSLASKLPQESLQLVIDSLWRNLISFSGVQRQVTSMILVSWFKELQNKGFSSLLVSQVDSSSLLKRCQLTTEFEIDSVSVDDVIEFASKLSLSGGTGKDTNEKQSTDDLESLRQRLLTTSGYLKCVQSNLHVTVSRLIAASVVWMSKLPIRLNPVILPLMASIKREQILEDWKFEHRCLKGTKKILDMRDKRIKENETAFYLWRRITKDEK